MLWGIILQFMCGLITIRWDIGRNILECFGQKLNILLDYSFLGATFAYGEDLVVKQAVFAFRVSVLVYRWHMFSHDAIYLHHLKFFASVFNKYTRLFQAMSTIYFISFLVNILYYYGIMQKAIRLIGEFLQWIMGTSICESVNSAANIFLGMVSCLINFMCLPAIIIHTYRDYQRNYIVTNVGSTTAS